MKPTKGKFDWDFNHRIENATEEQVDRITDAFIKAVECEGLFCGGGVHARQRSPKKRAKRAA